MINNLPEKPFNEEGQDFVIQYSFVFSLSLEEGGCETQESHIGCTPWQEYMYYIEGLEACRPNANP
jgi:hypothetical protein